MSQDVLAGAARLLGRTHKWVRFMSIVLFFSSGVMILVGLGAGVLGMAMGAGDEEANRAQAMVLLIVYPILGVLYIFPSLYLLRFANRGREFAASVRPFDLEQALDAQRSFWKFVGLSTAISVALAIVGIVLAVGLAALLTTR